MNYDLLLLVIFGLVVLAIMLSNKKRTEVQKILFPLIYMIIYRTKLGLKDMDKLASKHPKLLNVLSYVSITLGFIGMALMLFTFFKGAFDYFFNNMPSPVGLVLPGVETIPGLPKLSFWHWIIAIFILASVHEFSHGVFARLHKIKLKSSGFALLGILLPIVPAAFVEPDEKQLAKASKKAQLSVLSAGSFANLITALVFFLLFGFVLGPFTANMLEEVGVKIVNLESNGPAELAGIQINESILAINNIEVKNVDQFKSEMDKYSPYEKIDVRTDKGSYLITLAESSDNPEKSHLGVYITPIERTYTQEAVQKFGIPFIKVFIWLSILFSWLFMINLGVGLFNLLPLGILDGGKMYYLGVLHFVKNETIAHRIYKYTSIFLIALLLSLVLPQLYKSLIVPLVSFII